MDNEDKLEKAKTALTDWVFALVEDTDYISIIAFDSEPEVVLDYTQWDAVDRSDAEDTIRTLSAGGKTDMYGALETAADILGTTEVDGDVARRILLLSDGKQNEPNKADGAFKRLAARIDDQGTRIRAGGIGSSYDEDVIKALGTTARGQWLHIQNPQEIRDFFGTAVEEAQTVIGPEAELRFDVHPGVEVTEAFRAYPQVQRAEIKASEGVVTVPLPDLRQRTEQRVAMELHVPDQPAGPVTLADVELCCRGNPVATTAIDVTYTDDDDKLRQINEAVDLHLRKTQIRSELGDGNVGAAETVLEETKLVHDEATVADVERAVTRVEEHDDAATRNQTTLIDDEPDGAGISR